MSSHNVGSVGNRAPQIELADDVGRWWMNIPPAEDFIEGPHAPPAAARAVDDANVTLPDPSLWEFGETRQQLCLRHIEAKWDSNTLPFVSNLATPCIVIGALFIILALSAGVTSLTGWDIPGLEILLKNMPLSLALSLVMVRTGVHMLFQGVLFARRKVRFRQEAQEYNKIYRIKNNVEQLSEEQRKKELCEIFWFNQKMAPAMQIQNQIGPGALLGQQTPDIGSGRDAAVEMRYALAQLLPNSLPELPKRLGSYAPRKLAPLDLQKMPTPSLTESWYNWCNSNLKALGVFDMVLGQLLFATAAIAIFCVAFPGKLPHALDIIVHDPYLSISISFLMLSSWISCTRTGWRMLTYNKREDKRAALEEDLQLIDLGIEKRNAQLLIENIIAHLKKKENSEALITQVKGIYKAFLQGLPPLTTRLRRVRRRWLNEKTKESSFYHSVHKLGKKIVPYLATPSIILGVIITLLGLTCLGLSLGDCVPSSLNFLAKNTPISLLFSAGLILSGFHTIHRGTTMGERGMKEKWKGESVGYRKAFIEHLFCADYPDIISKPKPVNGPRREIHEVNLGDAPIVSPPNKDEVQNKIASTKSSAWYHFWTTSFKVMTPPDAILGAFLIFSSLTGIAILCGAHAPAHFDFILNDPSFSLSFCISLLAIGIDSINTSYRMGTYQSRKSQDRGNVDALAYCYKKLFPGAPLPVSQKV